MKDMVRMPAGSGIGGHETWLGEIVSGTINHIGKGAIHLQQVFVETKTVIGAKTYVWHSRTYIFR